MTFYGQLRGDELVQVRALFVAFGWDATLSMLEVKGGLGFWQTLHEGRAGELPRLDTLRVRARLRRLALTQGVQTLDACGAHLLAPLVLALQRSVERGAGEPLTVWGGDDWDLDARRDLVDVVRAVHERWPADPCAPLVLAELLAERGDKRTAPSTTLQAN